MRKAAFFIFITCAINCSEIKVTKQFSSATCNQWQKMNELISCPSGTDQEMYQTIQHLFKKEMHTVAATPSIHSKAQILLTNLENALETGSTDPEAELFKQLLLRSNKNPSPAGRFKKEKNGRWELDNLAQKIVRLSPADLPAQEKETYIAALAIVYFHKIEEKNKNATYKEADCTIV